MEVVPVEARRALALAEAVVDGTTLAVDRTHRRSHRAAVGIHRQPGTLQQRHAGDMLLGERHAARQHAPVAVDDDQPRAIRPAFLRQRGRWQQREQEGKEQQEHPKVIALLRGAGL